MNRLDLAADQAFVVWYLQQEQLLQQHSRKSKALQCTESILVEKEETFKQQQQTTQQDEEEARKYALELMRPLTLLEQDKVHKVLYSKMGRSNDVIAQIDADSVQRGSFQRLAPGQVSVCV